MKVWSLNKHDMMVGYWKISLRPLLKRVLENIAKQAMNYFLNTRNQLLLPSNWNHFSAYYSVVWFYHKVSNPWLPLLFTKRMWKKLRPIFVSIKASRWCIATVHVILKKNWKNKKNLKRKTPIKTKKIDLNWMIIWGKLACRISLQILILRYSLRYITNVTSRHHLFQSTPLPHSWLLNVHWWNISLSQHFQN